MDPITKYVLPLGGGLFLVFIIYTLRQNRSQRDVLLSRLGFKRQESQALRQQLDEKKATTASSPLTYVDTLPPLRNPTTTTLPLDAQFIPLGKKWDTLSGTELTATGFTVDEVKQLIGDMPDYATLSGVPLPEKVRDGFTIENAQPRPYRPLRWGYHQTMSLSKLDLSYWLELESTYASRITQRQGYYHAHKEHVLNCLPGAEYGCTELMEMCVQFLCARYPMYFSLTTTSTTTPGGKPERILHNAILNTTTDLSTTPALEVLLNNIPEDFGIMQRNPDNGLYYLRAGTICSALGWSLGSKMGKVLADVHEPVPDFKEKMQFSMDRYFAKMPTDMPIQRGSWGVERGELLFSPPFSPYSDHLTTERSQQDPKLTLDELYFRVDWQTLRRLPVSGFIIFNFKALFTPVTHFRHEPYIPSLLHKVLLNGKDNIMEYKGTWAIDHVFVPELEKWIREQEEDGKIEKDWEVGTLKEAPFFPGWRKIWLERMGLSEGSVDESVGKER